MAMAISRDAGSALASARAVVQASSSDEILIQRIADGDQLAMRALFARHRACVYRFVLRMVGDEALAEDVLSDVFLDVWRQAAQFERRSAVSTWLLAIARFKAISALRRRTDVELDGETAAAIIDSADDPEIALQKKHTRRAAAALVGEPAAGAGHGHRPCLLSRQVDIGGGRDRRHPGGDREVAHVLRAQEAGRVGQGGVARSASGSALTLPEKASISPISLGHAGSSDSKDVVLALQRHEPGVWDRARDQAPLLERSNIVMTTVQHQRGHLHLRQQAHDVDIIANMPNTSRVLR